MAGDQTAAIVAEVVRCVRGLSSKVDLSKEEQKFVNEQARLLSEQVMHNWAKGRYGSKRKIRACCVGLAMAIAMEVAHRMALPGDGIGDAAGGVEPKA